MTPDTRDRAEELEEVDVLRASAVEYAEMDYAAETEGDDQTYFIGKRDGYGEAVQTIDCATGGDGEYFFSTLGDDCADPPEMIAKIVERFDAALARVRELEAVLKPFADCYEDDELTASGEFIVQVDGADLRAARAVLSPGDRT